ncbi:hypothetical protein ACFE04_029267 [Oxalis oulophora]
MSLYSLLQSSLTPYIIISLLVFIIFIEQIIYLIKKRQAPGPIIVFPFLGNVISLVRNPTHFWDIQSSAATCGYSVNYVIGKFMVFIKDTDLSHLVFSNVRPDRFLLVGHPFGKKLFGDHNLIYLMGQDHKDLRGRIAPNFTPKALSTYTALQQIIILRHLKDWEQLANKESESIRLRLLVREMNLETSQTVFIGPYLNEEAKSSFRQDYNLFNVGLMKLPVDLPGFAFRNARLGVDRLVKTLTACAKDSKTKMLRGEEPECLIDYWMQSIVKEMSAAELAGEKWPPANYSDEHIGSYLFDFLFAAQDASTSSLLWAVALLDSHPAVLEKVREEVSRIWSPESDTLISADQLREMKYTHTVAREVIRYRAPATLVPHIAARDFPLTESFTIPKGAIVFPSVYDSSFQGFTDPDRFDPDRFNEERQEDQIYKRNFLAFGAGAHQCVGQRYALNHLVLFIAMFATLMDFKRHRSDGCDEIVYCPTICPKDECKVFLSRRCARYPNLSL